MWVRVWVKACSGFGLGYMLVCGLGYRLVCGLGYGLRYGLRHVLGLD